MLSHPDRDNIVGTQTIEGMWSLVVQGVCVFAISAELCGQVPLFAGECVILILVRLKYVQCLAVSFPSSLSTDANQVK